MSACIKSIAAQLVHVLVELKTDIIVAQQKRQMRAVLFTKAAI